MYYKDYLKLGCLMAQSRVLLVEHPYAPTPLIFDFSLKIRRGGRFYAYFMLGWGHAGLVPIVRLRTIITF